VAWREQERETIRGEGLMLLLRAIPAAAGSMVLTVVSLGPAAAETLAATAANVAARIPRSVPLPVALELDGSRVPSGKSLRPGVVRLTNREVWCLPSGGHLPFVTRQLRTNQTAVRRTFFNRFPVIAVHAFVFRKIEQRVERCGTTLRSRSVVHERGDWRRGLCDRNRFHRHRRVRSSGWRRGDSFRRSVGEHLGVERSLLRLLALAWNCGVLVFVVRVAGRTSCLLHGLPNHRHDDVIGEPPFAGTIIIQNVTEPRLALLHQQNSRRILFSGGEDCAKGSEILAEPLFGWQ